MGRLSRIVVVVLATAVIGLPLGAGLTRAGAGFSALLADATFGVEMHFSATWSGPEPDHVELLLGFGDDDRLAIPVTNSGGPWFYERDMAENYLPPNTTVSYQWRALDGASVTLSAERSLYYDDDRPQFDWDQARIGSATVH